MDLFGNTISALDSALGAAGMRQQVLANNLANVNTPGYKRSDVDFEQQLTAALDDGSSPTQLSSLTPTVQQDSSGSMRADGNNVDVDNEMSKLAANNVRYNALVQLAAKQLHNLSYVITDK